jgi:hypothetical protein
LKTQPDMASQIQILRRDIFWTRCILGAAVLCLVALNIASSRRHAQTIEANEFVLRDTAGNIAARLGKDKFGDTCLSLTAKENVADASICVQDGVGSYLDLFNLKSGSRAMLTPGFYMVEPYMPVEPALVINGKNYVAENK